MSVDLWADDHSVEEIHELAVAIGALYDERPESLAYLSQAGYEYWMTSPTPPHRWKGATGGEESSLWLEWHRLRGLDPGAKRSRSLSPALRRAVVDRDGYVCGLCGGDVAAGDVHIDHIVPWSLGGRDEMENLQVAHAWCNRSKGARV